MKQAFNKQIGLSARFDLALLDLGFSNFQLWDRERGFGYKGPDEQPLDMRYNKNEGVTAEEIINNATEMELSEVFKRFGDERYHELLARKIVEARGSRITTTGDLKKIIRDEFSNSIQSDRNQMIKRIFQALRIATNQEILNIQKFLELCPDDIMG
jgi:16S rRNA (cytosine1402-N4)-methyltransferase